MKKNMIKVASAFAALSLVFVACGKYEDGPSLSLRTKKARLTGVWDVKEYESSNGTVVADNDDETFEILKDGTTKTVDGNTILNGTWKFGDKKETVINTITVNIFGANIDLIDTVTILRLTNSELWIKDNDGDITKSVKK